MIFFRKLPRGFSPEGFWGPLFIVLLVLSLQSCTVRNRDNPFDQSGEQRSPIRLSLSYSGPIVRLSWNIENINDYSGFRIYRSVRTDQNFQLLKEVAPGIFSMTDPTITNGQWYFYKVTIVGPSAESLPSNIEKTFPGPGHTWVLSSSGFWLKELSYDLQHVLKDIPTEFPAESWDLFLPDSVAWLTFSNFGRVDELNLRLEQATQSIESSLVRPVDVSYDPFSRRLFVLDDSLNTVFIFRDYNLVDTLQLAKDQYQKMNFSPGSRFLTILGREAYYSFSSDGNSRRERIKFPGSFQGKDFNTGQNDLFVLAYSDEESISRIYRGPVDGSVQDSLTLNGNFYKITPDLDRNVLYLAEDVPSADDPVVKLSPTGQRLESLSQYSRVAQIVINPGDHSVVVVDRFKDRLVLFDAEGNFIAQSVSLFDPIRARTE